MLPWKRSPRSGGRCGSVSFFVIAWSFNKQIVMRFFAHICYRNNYLTHDVVFVLTPFQCVFMSRFFYIGLSTHHFCIPISLLIRLSNTMCSYNGRRGKIWSTYNKNTHQSNWLYAMVWRWLSADTNFTHFCTLLMRIKRLNWSRECNDASYRRVANVLELYCTFPFALM